MNWPIQVDRWVFGVLSVSTVAILALVPLLALPARYELTLDELRVRSGVLRTRLAWADVVRIELTSSLVSSTTAAWAFQRVALVTEGGRVLEVGPRDRRRRRA